MNELKPRRKIRGNIALVVRGGHARIEDVVVISGHRTRETAEIVARKHIDPTLPYYSQPYVMWADEFVDAGGTYA
jgi:hypothetical protein